MSLGDPITSRSHESHESTSNVHVPVSGSDRPATLNRDDFLRLQQAGLASGWFLVRSAHGKSYVRVGRLRWSGHQQTVARLLIGAQPGQHVRYSDGDSLNLLRPNLRVLKTRPSRRRQSNRSQPTFASRRHLRHFVQP